LIDRHGFPEVRQYSVVNPRHNLSSLFFSNLYSASSPHHLPYSPKFRQERAMRTPTKRSRPIEDGEAPSTPRSSKRLRAAAEVGQSTPVKSEASSPRKTPVNKAVNGLTSPSKRKTPLKTKAESPVDVIEAEVHEVDTASRQKQSKARPPTATATAASIAAVSTPIPGASPPAPSREPAAEPQPKKQKGPQRKAKPSEMAPLATRAVDHVLRLGAHISAAGGVHNSVGNAVHIGANAFALFLKSQRKWANPPLQDEHRTLFVDGCKTHHYDALKHVVPHGSYLVNLAQPEADKAMQAYDSFLDDLQRCARLGIRLYNFHPGSTVGAPRDEALKRIADRLNAAHAATTDVVTLLENMAGKGNTIGGTFADLGGVIRHVTDKNRVGICLDTCHAFAAGYDIRTAAGLSKVLDSIEEEVGKGMLRALHVNDSKAPLGSHRDLHANIGTGFLGLRAFHALVNEERLHGLPMVLETPIDEGGNANEESKGTEDAKGKEVSKVSKGAKAKEDAKAKKKPKPQEDKSVWAREIKLLESLVGMDPDSEEFAAIEARLAAEGKNERARIQDQVDRAKVKAGKTGMKGKGKTMKKGKKEETTDEEEGSDEE
jgi:AP endonuclease 1